MEYNTSRTLHVQKCIRVEGCARIMSDAEIDNSATRTNYPIIHGKLCSFEGKGSFQIKIHGNECVNADLERQNPKIRPIDAKNTFCGQESQ